MALLEASQAISGEAGSSKADGVQAVYVASAASMLSESYLSDAAALQYWIACLTRALTVRASRLQIAPQRVRPGVFAGRIPN